MKTIKDNAVRRVTPRAVVAGVTLVELLVAMTLGLAIVAGVTYVYVQGKQGFSVQDARARLQEDARLAFSTIQRDVMMAGYFGCMKAYDPKPADPFTNVRITASRPLMAANMNWMLKSGSVATGGRFLSADAVIQGYDNGVNWPMDTGASVLTTRITGTDTIVLLRGGDDARHLTAAVDEAATTFAVATPLAGVSAGLRAMVISNCTAGEIIKPTVASSRTSFTVDNTFNCNDQATGAACSTNAEENTLRGASGTSYDTSSMVTTFEPVTYYVANAIGSGNRQVPSLYRMGTQTGGIDTTNGQWSLPGNIVLQGVERLQIRYYTSDASSGATTGPFTAANVPSNGGWRSLSSIEFTIGLVSDSDAVATLSSTQTVGSVTSTDNRLRLTSTFTVNLRNPRT